MTNKDAIKRLNMLLLVFDMSERNPFLDEMREAVEVGMAVLTLYDNPNVTFIPIPKPSDDLK